MSIEGTAHKVLSGPTSISVYYPFKFQDSSTREKYELGWHHLTDAQIFQEGQDPEALKVAAAGALVGFLLAGSLGTAAGGLMGVGS